jgi:hypothetical protein
MSPATSVECRVSVGRLGKCDNDNDDDDDDDDDHNHKISPAFGVMLC